MNAKAILSPNSQHQLRTRESRSPILTKVFEPSLGTHLDGEAVRLRKLYSYQLLDTLPDPALDDLTNLAADLCHTPIAMISFVDSEYQWFKSCLGLDLVGIPRNVAFGNYTIQQSEPFIVKDTRNDERFAQNPLVSSDFGIRFYAGVPLITAEGEAIGTLCVMDYRSRHLNCIQIQGLQRLSRQVMAQLELQRTRSKLRLATQKLQYLDQQFLEREFVTQQESLLFGLATQIRNSFDLDIILQTAVNQIRNLMQVEQCYFLWCLPTGKEFSIMVTHEATSSELPSFLGDLPPQQSSLFIDGLLNLKILRIEDITTSPNLTAEVKHFLHQLGIQSQLMLPLKTHSSQFGALVCNNYSVSRAWTDVEVNLLQAVTSQLAIALDQADLFAQTRATACAAQTQSQYLSDALRKLQQAQAQLVQHEKMSGLGQLVAGVAHEINNPVNFILGNVTYAADYVKDLLELLILYQKHYPTVDQEIEEKAEEIDLTFLTEDLPKLLASMKMGADRIRQIVLSLRNFSRLDESERKPVDIHEGIDNTLLILQSRLKATKAGHRIHVAKSYGVLPQVDCYAGQMNQVFMNLLSNAIDALEEHPGEPTITIHTEVAGGLPDAAESGEEIQDKPHIIIRISDNGSGMPEEVQQKVFNPFFTTKPVGKGTGLGLSISYQIVVEKHGGILKCNSEPGQGTEFWIQIPVNLAKE